MEANSYAQFNANIVDIAKFKQFSSKEICYLALQIIRNIVV